MSLAMSRQLRDPNWEQNHMYRADAMPDLLPPSSAMYGSRLSLPAYYYGVSAAPPLPMNSDPASNGYNPYENSAPAVMPPPSIQQHHRASSGAWTPAEDALLMKSRRQGLNWGQIQTTNFPSKTPNACRKRHERLMERAGLDDFDTRKFEQLAKEYITMRKEVWGPLASRVGEKWSVVEQKILSSGLKNLQSAARAATRRERLESGQPLPPDYDDGMDGLDLTPVDEMEPPYSGPDMPHPNSSSTAGPSDPGQYTSAHLQPLSHYYGPPHHAYPGSISSGGPPPTYAMPHSRSHSSSQDSAVPYSHDPQRMSTVDMGIDAIINRPVGNTL